MHSATQSQSPAFGYLSPPIDSADDASDDGDDLQTPITQHDQPYSHRPYAVYQQHSHTFNSSPLSSYTIPGPPHVQDAFDQNHVKPSSTEIASYPSLLSPSSTENIVSGGLHSFYPYSSPTPHALDLANASLEFDPFAASFGGPGDGGPSCLDHHSFDSYAVPRSPSVEPPPDLPPLPALTVDGLQDICSSSTSTLDESFLFEASQHSSDHPPALPERPVVLKGRAFSPRFPEDHNLNPFFARTYLLGDELGAGGYGFVMTARHLELGHEVAVKFIIKSKVPDHCWWEDEILGRVPTEVLVMSLLNHKHIVKCLDLFEDDLYFYLVQELHGTPWVSRSRSKKGKQMTAPCTLAIPSPAQLSTPLLTPSPSTESEGSLLSTPPQLHVEVMDTSPSIQSPSTVSPAPSSSTLASSSPPLETKPSPSKSTESLLPPESRPSFSRRPSYDLFECIEQSKHKRLSENQARYIFAQVVEAVHYLDSQGITHCDIKDENLVVDKDLNVKLIDFGSAVVADPSEPRPYYTLFFGTTAYAASEILQKKAYLAAPAEIWTLGVLLSYLLTGNSPFPTEQDAINARIVIKESMSGKLSRSAMGLMQRCLEKDPKMRAGIKEVREHKWLKGALEREMIRE